MRRRRFRLAWVALVGASAGCGGAATSNVVVPTAVPAGPAPSSPAPLANARPPANDLGPVPPPADLAFVVRFARPRATLNAALDLAGSAVPASLGIGFEPLAQLALGDAIAGIVDFERPVDVVALMRDPSADPVVAVAASVGPIEEVKTALEGTFRITNEAGGVYRLVPEGGARAPLADKMKCELRPSTDGYRLCCAESRAVLAATAPYLARTVANEAWSSDVHLEISMRGIVKSIEDSVALKADDAAAAAFGRDLSLGYFRDVSAVAFDLALDRAMAEVTFTQRLQPRAPITRIVARSAEPAGPLPDAFWRLPADTGSAVFLRGVTQGELGELRAATFASLRASLDDDGAPAAVRDRFTTTLEGLVLTGGPAIVAHGFDADAARKALARRAPSTLAAKQADARARTGWWLVELDEPASRWSDGLRALVALDAVKYPSKAATARPTKTTLRASTGALPPGWFRFDVASTANGRPNANGANGANDVAPSVVHVLVAPDGARTWIGIGEEERVVRARLESALRPPSGGAGTLATRAGLDTLHAARTNAAGFTTLADDVAFGLASGVADDDRASARRTLEALAAAGPGTTPLPFLVDLAPPHAAGGPVAVPLRLQVPKAAIGEWIAFMKSMP